MHLFCAAVLNVSFCNEYICNVFVLCDLSGYKGLDGGNE